MKKIILFFMFLLFPIMINADEKTIFSLDEVTASSGNNVTINLNLQNKQKFGVLTARIHFDNSKIEYVSSELKGLKSGTIKGTDDNNDKGLVAIYAISLNQKKLMADNGNILTIEFKIKDDVSGDIPIELEIVDFGVDESKSLDYEKKDGVIHIKENVKTVPKKSDESASSDYKEEAKKNEEDDITWSSTNPEIATVDEDGNVTFNNNGNVTIEAKDKNGNVVYSKDYFVKDKVKKNYPIKVVIIAVVTIIVLVLIIRRRHKCKKER